MLEQELSPVPLSCLPWLASPLIPTLLTHLTIEATLKVILSSFNLQNASPHPSPMIQILLDLEFTLDNTNKHLDHLMDAGKFCLLHLTLSFRCPPLENIQQMLDPSTDSWSAYRIQHFLKSTIL